MNVFRSNIYQSEFKKQTRINLMFNHKIANNVV